MSIPADTPSSTHDPGNHGRAGHEHSGPPLVAPVIAFTIAFLASIGIGPASGAGAVPSPFGDQAAVTAYFSHSAVATSSWLMLVSALALVVFSALVLSRLVFLAPNTPGPAVAGLGGLTAALLLAGSATTLWVLAQIAAPQRSELVGGLHYLGFVVGGPAHTAALGLLVLGMAMTTRFLRRTPRILSVLGIVVALVDLTSTLVLLTESAAPLVPAGRFLTIVWLVVMSLLIPRHRAARRPAAVTGRTLP